MATPESVKNKIQGLIDAANFITDKDDDNLTDGVYSLIKGYGSGGAATVIANGKTLTIKRAAVTVNSDNSIIIGE